MLLEQLSNNGNGTYAYVDDLLEAKRLFMYDLTATLQVIALNAKVQVDFKPDVIDLTHVVGTNSCPCYSFSAGKVAQTGDVFGFEIQPPPTICNTIRMALPA